MRWLLLALLAILLVLQYRLWIAEGSLAELNRLQRQYDEQARINEQLQQRNAALELEVLELQSGNEGLEQRAREQLGLVREGETFYQFTEEPRPGRPASLPAVARPDAAEPDGVPTSPAGPATPAERQP